LIIPWKVDVPQDRLPLTNWLLIASIIVVFIWEMPQIQTYNKAIQKKQMELLLAYKDPNTKDLKYIESEFKKIKNPLNEYMLNGWTGKGLFTHMWLHGGWIHLIGNMLFLWIFGNAVCAKIGNILYAPIYIIAGLSAAITYLFFSNHPMLGASGAINGIVGIYLVFFPINSITCYWSLNLLYWKEFEAPSYAIILLWLAYDIFGAFIGGSNIAYFAHFGGFASGFVIAIILLKTRLIKMTEYEKSLLDIIFEKQVKPQPKESYFNRDLLTKVPDSQASAAEEIPAGTIGEKKQAPQSVLSAEDFFRQPTAEPPPPTQLKANIGDGFIRFFCICGKRIKVAEQFAGRTGKCPQCKRSIKIPKPD